MTTDPRDRLNVSVEQLNEGLAAYRQAGATDAQIDLIEWAFCYCAQSLDRDISRFADELGYHRTNAWKLFMGRYEGSLDRVCEAIADLRTRAENTIAVDFVRTPVTDRISQTLDYARDMNAMVVIRGDTGRGKSLTAEMWQGRNNHGRTFYYQCEERTTYARFLGGLSRAMSISGGRSADSYRVAIQRRVSRRNTLVIDEAGHLYNPRRPDTGAFDFLRDLHDRNHCGIAMIFTFYYWDLICNGPLAGFFEQFLGRISYELVIPKDTIYLDEIVAICAAFCPAPTDDLIAEAGRIAKASLGKIRALVKCFQYAAIRARDEGRTVTAKDLRAARQWREKGGDWSELATM